MDEYQYEDFDDAPSQALVLSQRVDTSHNNSTTNDDNLEQPSKRPKLSHGDENQDQDESGYYDTQLTQPSDTRKKIPGPAGSLPPLSSGQGSFPSKTAVVPASNKENVSNGLVIQSKLQRTIHNGHDLLSQDDYGSDFTRGTWIVMLKHSELPPFGMRYI